MRLIRAQETLNDPAKTSVRLIRVERANEFYTFDPFHRRQAGYAHLRQSPCETALRKRMTRRLNQAMILFSQTDFARPYVTFFEFATSHVFMTEGEDVIGRKRRLLGPLSVTTRILTSHASRVQHSQRNKEIFATPSGEARYYDKRLLLYYSGAFSASLPTGFPPEAYCRDSISH